MKFAAELMCFRSIWGGDDSANYASETMEGNLKGDLTSLTRTSPSNSMLITYKKKKNKVFSQHSTFTLHKVYFTLNSMYRGSLYIEAEFQYKFGMNLGYYHLPKSKVTLQNKRKDIDMLNILRKRKGLFIINTTVT